MSTSSNSVEELALTGNGTHNSHGDGDKLANSELIIRAVHLAIPGDHADMGSGVLNGIASSVATEDREYPAALAAALERAPISYTEFRAAVAEVQTAEPLTYTQYLQAYTDSQCWTMPRSFSSDFGDIPHPFALRDFVDHGSSDKENVPPTLDATRDDDVDIPDLVSSSDDEISAPSPFTSNYKQHRDQLHEVKQYLIGKNRHHEASVITNQLYMNHIEAVKNRKIRSREKVLRRQLQKVDDRLDQARRAFQVLMRRLDA